MNYTNLRRLESPPPIGMSDSHLRALRRNAAEVCRRKRCLAWLDVANEQIVFGQRRGGDVQTIVGFPIFKGDAPQYLDPLHDWDVEDACYAIWLAEQPIEAKKKRAMWQSRNRRAESREELGQEIERHKRRVVEEREMARRAPVSIAI